MRVSSGVEGVVLVDDGTRTAPVVVCCTHRFEYSAVYTACVDVPCCVWRH